NCRSGALRKFEPRCAALCAVPAPPMCGTRTAARAGPTDRSGRAVRDHEIPPAGGPPRHHVTWNDFDAVAGCGGGADVVRRFRRAERSRRLLLVRAIVDQAGKTPELTAPLPSPEDAWDLLARAQTAAPSALDAVLTHPYTGTWAGYTARLL